jgi:hypothetical protein
MMPMQGMVLAWWGDAPKFAKALAIRDCQGLRSLSVPQGNVLPSWSGTMWFMVGVFVSTCFLLALALSGQGLTE